MALPRPTLLAAACAAATVVTSCSDGLERSAAAYCGQVQANIVALNTPAISTIDDVTATIELYRSIADRAPAAIEPEWQVMITSLETAATVVPGDAASAQRVTDAALASQPAATRIQQYTQQTCGTDIGTPPPTTYPVTVTTVDPSGSVPATGPAPAQP